MNKIDLFFGLKSGISSVPSLLDRPLCVNCSLRLEMYSYTPPKTPLIIHYVLK